MADPNIIPLANHMLSSIQKDLNVLKDQQVLDDSSFQRIMDLLPTHTNAVPPPSAPAVPPSPSPRSSLSTSHTIRPPLPVRKSIANSSPIPAPRALSSPKRQMQRAPEWPPSPSPQLEQYQTQSQTNIPHTTTSIPSTLSASYHKTAKSNKKMAVALYDYAAEDPDTDLAFRKGDMIEVTEHVNEDWWRGTLNGNSGIFPQNHVQL